MEIYRRGILWRGSFSLADGAWKMRDRSSRRAIDSLGRPSVFLSPGNPRHQISVLGQDGDPLAV
jgi:hypothetical protein